MKNKILLLSYRLGYDSLLYWDNILSSINDNFSNFRVFTAHPSIKSKNGLLSTEERLTGIKYHKNPTKTYGKLYFFPMPFFVKEIIKYKPDVIVLNEFNLANFYALFFKVFYRKTKFILLVESDPGLGNIKHKKNTIRLYYRQYISKKVDLILTNNNLGLNYLNEYLNIDLNKITQAPYLTSCPENNIIKDSTNNKFINFLYVGQIIERKGLIYLFEALDLLPSKVKNSIHFDIIGGGDMELELKKYVEDKELTFVNFRGKLPFNELSQYYYNADCFVLPTLHDYRALVGFEALYYGCAIIDSIYDGARFEVVEEGKNGYIINPKNIDEFSSAIIKIAEDKNKLESFKNHSLKIVKSFTYQECNNNLIDAIRKV